MQPVDSLRVPRVGAELPWTESGSVFSNSYRLILALLLVWGASLPGVPSLASFPSSFVPPAPARVFQDAITGDNQFTSSDGRASWFVNTGADNYFEDVYERPTIQNYERIAPGYPDPADPVYGTDSELAALLGQGVADIYATNSSGPTYFEHIDITRGLYGYDATFMYFGIELFGEDKVSEDGTRTPDFGESAFYRVRISNDPDGAGGLMLSAEAGADFQKSEFFAFNDQKAFGYLDENRDVGGPGGITVVNELSGAMNGFDPKVISDGKAEGGDKPEILNIRRTNDGLEGRPIVEFALNYAKFNELYPAYALDPDILCIVFEANRGTKDNQNYLWNDKYNYDEAGSPYDDENEPPDYLDEYEDQYVDEEWFTSSESQFDDNEPQNVYELDTLRGCSSTVIIPEPGPIAMLIGLGVCVLGPAGWRFLARRRRKQGELAGQAWGDSIPASLGPHDMAHGRNPTDACSNG